MFIVYFLCVSGLQDASCTWTGCSCSQAGIHPERARCMAGRADSNVEERIRGDSTTGTVPVPSNVKLSP